MAFLTRRTLLAAGAATPLAGSLTGLSGNASPSPDAETPEPTDADFWSWVATQYDTRSDFINVENGNWGLMARPVLDAYLAHTEKVNRENSFFARREYGPMAREIQALLRDRLGADDNEVALTRGATEALQNIIGGYNKLKPDDAVMMADLDYGAMMEAMRWRAEQSGCEVVTLSVPENAGYDELISFYEKAFQDHPNTRFLLLTHISHRTGLMLPIREICEIAHRRGIDVVVDAAHSWGQVDFDAKDLGADFVGFNLHKWIGAPIGVGAMYIQADKLGDISLNMSEASSDPSRIYTRVHSGTSNFAAYMTIPDAFAFQDSLARADKFARLKQLRQIWVDEVRDVSGIDVLTPDDDRLHGGITSFRFSGMTSSEDNQAIAAYLLEKHKVFTVHRTGIANGACVRITPGYYNSIDDMQRTAMAVLDAHRHFKA